MPLAVLGLLFGKAIKANLFNPVTVATTFILGGFIILWAERREHRVRVDKVEDLSYADAFKLGLAQACALIPGTSRSGATIIGGLLFGLSRKAATEFSFFLAIPTLLGATAYQLYKERHLLAMDDLGMWLVGFFASFVSAFLCVRWLLRFIATHDFTVFAWYRIAFGIVVLVTWQFGRGELAPSAARKQCSSICTVSPAGRSRTRRRRSARGCASGAWATGYCRRSFRPPRARPSPWRKAWSPATA
jgi:undecaprenyl-diphosphatase